MCLLQGNLSLDLEPIQIIQDDYTLESLSKLLHLKGSITQGAWINIDISFGAPLNALQLVP